MTLAKDDVLQVDIRKFRVSAGARGEKNDASCSFTRAIASGTPDASKTVSYYKPNIESKAMSTQPRCVEPNISTKASGIVPHNFPPVLETAVNDEI